MTCALLTTGTASKSKLSRVLPGGNRASARWRSSRRRLRSAISSSANEARKKFHLLILDDIAYVTKDQAETSVLFELISARYERRSLLITANQPFGEWGKIFPEPTTS